MEIKIKKTGKDTYMVGKRLEVHGYFFKPISKKIWMVSVYPTQYNYPDMPNFYLKDVAIEFAKRMQTPSGKLRISKMDEIEKDVIKKYKTTKYHYKG